MTAAPVGAVLAGAPTTLAPCALTLLPVVVGGSLQGAATSQARRRVWLIAGALGRASSRSPLLLRATTALIDVPTTVWRLVSGPPSWPLAWSPPFPALGPGQRGQR